MNKPAPTLQTIADAMGVSRMTVSRALRNDPSIPDQTCERIKAEAEKQGYRPDPLVSALMTRLRTTRTHKENPIIAYLDTIPRKTNFVRFSYLAQMQAGAEKRTRELGYRFEYFNLPNLSLDEERIGQILYSRGIRGLVLAPMAENGPFRMDFSTFAASTLGSSVTDPILHSANSSALRNIQVAFNETAKLGCRRVGLVLDKPQDERTEYVISAMMLRYQNLLKEEDRIPTLILDSFSQKECENWLLKHKPEAVYGFIHDLGWISRSLNIGNPLFVNLNWQLNDGSDYGVDQNLELVGSAAVDLVVEQLQSNQYGVPVHPKRVFLLGRWVKSGKQSEMPSMSK